MKKKAVIIGMILLVAATAFLLVWTGMIIPNNIKARKYEVRGVDVSSYQGNIDWSTLGSQDISFAFVKATEGSSYVDESFEYNYKEARNAGLRVGAYHFFSYDSLGSTQGENFIQAVDKYEDMLPPVIDVEFYGDKESDPPNKEYVHEQLDTLIEMLAKYYERKPIIYATQKSYSMYIKDYYKEYSIWIRNVVTEPHLNGSCCWTFWQYTDRGRLKGYTGKEKYIDLNVYNGSWKEFEMYGR